MSGQQEKANTTGESHPLVRGAAKAVALGVWCIFTIGAMGASWVVGVERWESYVKAGVLADPLARYVAFAVMVLVFLGADAWVGVSGVIIKATRRWQQPEDADRGDWWARTVAFWSVGPWIWLGRAVFILALLISSTNKVAFWGSMGQAHVTASLDARSGDDRNLVNAHPNVRESSIVAAARDGVAAELSIQAAKVAGLERREGRYAWATAQARGEQVKIQQRLTPLETELKTAQAVEAAQARLAAVAAKDSKTTRAEEDAMAEKVADPRDAWLARVFNIQVWAIALAVIGATALLHELGCACLLGLATMRPPAWAIAEETAFIIVSRTAGVERKARIRAAKIEQQSMLQRSLAVAAARAAMIPEIAAAEARLERQRSLAEIAKMRKEAFGDDDPGDDVPDVIITEHDGAKPAWWKFNTDRVPRHVVRGKSGDQYRVKSNGGLPSPSGFGAIREMMAEYVDVPSSNAAQRESIRAASEAAAKADRRTLAERAADAARLQRRVDELEAAAAAPAAIVSDEPETEEQRAQREAFADEKGVTVGRAGYRREDALQEESAQ